MPRPDATIWNDPGWLRPRRPRLTAGRYRPVLTPAVRPDTNCLRGVSRLVRCVGVATSIVCSVVARGYPHGAGTAFCQFFTSLVLATSFAGCSQYIDPNVPEPIRPFTEPAHEREYLLYRPSNYDRAHSWPLIVVCHTSFPDSPNRQIRAWTELAESRGFLVVAPTLHGTAKSSRPKVAERIRLLRDDEEHILATVQHVRAGHTVSDDRIFIHGWSGGAHAALYAGLRHPELFRAISVIQPRFKSGCLGDVQDIIEPSQPVLVNYSVGDALTGRQGEKCVDWLRRHGARLYEDPTGPADKHDTARAVEFFEDIIKHEPWIRIDGAPLDGATARGWQFKLNCPEPPLQYKWEFGDGDESTVAEPIHVYSRPGTYRVEVTIRYTGGREYRRTLDVTAR